MSREDRERWEGRWPGRAAGEPSAFVVEHADLLPAGRTIDLACGAGRNARYLASRGHRVTAVDVARSALDGLRSVPGVAPVQMDLDAPGFREAAADCVITVDFLDRRLLGELPRLLRPGGVLLVDTFLADPRATGHPRSPEHRLRPNELLERFRTLRVLRFREGECGAGTFRSGIVAARDGGF